MLLSGVSFLRRIVDLHHSAGLPVCVVLGYSREEILRTLDLSDVTVLINSHPERGQLSSLHIGLREMLDRPAVLVHPVDHPAVKGDTIAALLRSHLEAPESIIIPEHAGRKGHPVLFPRRFYPDLLRAPLYEGARHVVRRSPEELRTVLVSDVGILRNIDTPSDYQHLQEDDEPEQ
jgi:molybdenum cofactor cytidylyltransferase